MKSNQFLIKFFSIAGMAGPLFFIVLVVVLGFIWDGYSPIKQFISEVGAINSPYSLIMQFAGFSLLGLSWISFCLLLLIELKRTWRSRIGILLLFLGSVAMFMVGFYPCDVSCINVTVVGRTHSVLAMISNISFVFGMLILHFQLHEDLRFSKSLRRKLFIMAVISNILSPLIILPQLEYVTGIIQRIALLIPLIWTIIISCTIYLNINRRYHFSR